MFRFGFILFVVFSVFLFVLSSSAQTPSPDLQQIIKQLQDQIKLLNQQILDLQSSLKKTEEEVEIIKAELKFTKSLRKGESGDEVRQLQEFLRQFPDIYPEGIVTGFFGSLTETAVRRFQEKHGIESIGIVGPKTIQRLNEFSLGAIPAIPAIPTSPFLPFQPVSASQPLVPAIPAIPAVPGVSSATPAVPAIPATLASTSAVKTPTPTPTPASTTNTFVVQSEGGPSGQIYSGQLLKAIVTVHNLTCRFTSCDSPPTTVKVYYTLWYPNDPPNIEVGLHYSEKTFSVPSISGWGQYQFNWEGTAGAAGKYYFVSVVDPDNLQGLYRGSMRSEFNILSTTTSTFTPTPTPTPASPTNCTDSDGLNYYTYGTLTYTSGPVLRSFDVCDVGSNLIERVCNSSDDANNFIRYTCPNGCSNGVCLSVTPTPTPTPSPQANNCTDSDGGNDYYIKGNVTITFNTGEVLNEYEFCVSSTDVKERYCDSSQRLLYNSVDQRCLFGCVDGACLRTPPAPTGSVSFSPSNFSQISAMANILNALKSILQTLSNLIP